MLGVGTSTFAGDTNIIAQNLSGVSTRGIVVPPGYDEFIYLPVPILRQSDSKWSGELLDPSSTSTKTIGSHGCTVTSFAMIASYLKGYSVTPLEVCANGISGSNGYEYYTAATEYGFDVSRLDMKEVSDTYAKSVILTELRRDRPVLVGFKNGSKTHFVVAKGYYKTDAGVEEYMINDPSTYYDKDSIDEYFDSGWSVYRMVVYTK